MYILFVYWDIIEKDTVDEIILRTNNVRNRLMLELMARGGIRVGEVLKLTPAEILDRKLILNDTKSGKDIQACKGPKFTLERSVIPKPLDGLKTFTHKNYEGDSYQVGFTLRIKDNFWKS